MRTYTEKLDPTNLLSDAFLSVNSCGRQIKNGYDYQVIRQNGREDFHLLYVISGFAYTINDGKETMLKPGDALLYLPHERQHYIFYERDRCETYFLHFSGQSAEEVLRRLRLWGKRIIHPGESTEIKSLFTRLSREHDMAQEGYEILCASLTLELLALISRRLYSTADRPEKIEKIRPVIDCMQGEYREPIDIDAYAAMCHISKTRFIHLFKEIMGVPPYRYQLSLRLERAEELLRHSSLQIGEIADAVGFSDPLYFSRVFKKRTGLSPAAFRAEDKEQS